MSAKVGHKLPLELERIEALGPEGVLIAAVVARLRAVNVGGTGKLAMSKLKAMCVDEGYSKIRTNIASGNVVFESKASQARIKAALETRLERFAGRPIGVFVSTADEMLSVLKSNPFPKAALNRTIAFFWTGHPQPAPSTI